MLISSRTGLCSAWAPGCKKPCRSTICTMKRQGNCHSCLEGISTVPISPHLGILLLWDASPHYPAVSHSPRPGTTRGRLIKFKEKADQEQALAWLRENLNPDARPGRERHKKCLSGRKKKTKKEKIIIKKTKNQKNQPKKTTNLKPQKPQSKKEVSGVTT